MKKVLIFGACGFVGKYLAAEFENHEYKVYLSDIKRTGNILELRDFEVIDILCMESIKNIINKIKPNYIINLAAISSVGISWIKPQLTIEINVIGSLNIMEAARLSLVKPKIMFIGSSEEYALTDDYISEKTPLDASNPYGISKLALEKFVQIYRNQYSLDICYVRPFNHTGIGQLDSFVIPNFCKQIAEIEKSGKPGTISVGNLKDKRDFSDVRDIVRAYRMIIESEDNSQIYNVGSGKSYALDDILNYIISLCNQKVTIKVDKSKIRENDAKNICCDFSYINRNFGWKPEISIKDTIKEIYEYYLIN